MRVPLRRMLRRIRIKNFKLLRDVTLEFPYASVPTVLIGTNASGKSTVIEVLDFLAIEPPNLIEHFRFQARSFERRFANEVLR